MLRSGLVVSLLLAWCGVACVFGAVISVKTPLGTVNGISGPMSHNFLGIPYAQQPVGALRWAPTKPIGAWASPLNATAVGPICPQVPNPAYNLPNPQSEACLTMQIWTPLDVNETLASGASASGAAAKPVIVFIHGGGYVWGSGSQQFYNGAELANATDSIVVTFNYRLGVFGYLALSQLAGENNGASGNYGVYDQVEALKFVQLMIPSFGGDASKVTVSGQSAGAASVVNLVASPLSKGLYDSAISMSAPLMPVLSQTQAQSMGNDVASKAGCTGSTILTCMRSKNFTQLLSASASTAWAPVLDNHVIPQPPAKAIRLGEYNEVPLILGAMENDGALIVYMENGLEAAFDLTMSQFNSSVVTAFGQAVLDAVWLLYEPATAFVSPFEALSAVITDAYAVCPARYLAQAVTARKGAPAVYRYVGVHTNSFSLNGTEFGPTHMDDLPYVFNQPCWLFCDYHSGAFTSPEEQMRDAFHSYWGAFAATGDPNSGATAVWPEFNLGTQYSLEFNTSMSIVGNYKSIPCLFWDTVYAVWFP